MCTYPQNGGYLHLVRYVKHSIIAKQGIHGSQVATSVNLGAGGIGGRSLLMVTVRAPGTGRKGVLSEPRFVSVSAEWQIGDPPKGFLNTPARR